MVRELCNHEINHGVKDFCWPCFFYVNQKRKIEWSKTSATLFIEGLYIYKGYTLD